MSPYSGRNFLCGLGLGAGMILLYLQMNYGPWNLGENEASFNQSEDNFQVRDILANLITKLRNPPPIAAYGIKTEKSLSNSTCNYPEIKNVVQFFAYRMKEKHCRKLVGFGGPKIKKEKTYYEGEKQVCMDEEYNIKPGNCTVLSFGINNDWSFDDAMGEFGCKVFSFDPTIGKEDHKRSANVRFLNLGLGDEKKVQNFPNNKRGKLDRYEGILQTLHLIDREIDYLKIDIEGSEMHFFKDIFETSPHLLKNVKQIGMEIHPGAIDALDFKVSKKIKIYPLWHGMQKLECAGFKLIADEMNLAGGNPYKWWNREESQCYEIVWGRLPTKQ